MSDLSEARRALDAAKGSFADALVAAHAAGASYRTIGAQVGLSHERVRQIVRARGAEPTKMRERLAVLDARWDALVDSIARPDLPLGDSLLTEQRRRNGAQRLARKRGAGRIPTVRAEMRDEAEAQLLQSLEDGVGDPRVDALRRELVEAQTLRERLSSCDDDLPF